MSRPLAWSRSAGLTRRGTEAEAAVTLAETKAIHQVFGKKRGKLLNGLRDLGDYMAALRPKLFIATIR